MRIKHRNELYAKKNACSIKADKTGLVRYLSLKLKKMVIQLNDLVFYGYCNVKENK